MPKNIPTNSRKKMLEVCVDSWESALAAVVNGADELEVCSCLPQGGLTPSAGLVKHVINVIDQYVTDNDTAQPLKKPKVNVMIRSRVGSDFCYSFTEMNTMLEDIDIFKGMGVDRFVFGSITENQQVDDVNCIRVLAQAYPTPVTFHRAFDLCKDPIAALLEIIQLGFDRVLTSGQKETVSNSEAVSLIKKLLELYSDKIEIMPGAGISVHNARTFIDLGCKIVHSSCKMLLPLAKVENDLSLDDCRYLYRTDGSIVKEIKKIIS